MVITKESIENSFNLVDDPRSRKCPHNFYDILTIAICCAICGLYEWEDMELFAELHCDWLREKLGVLLEKGIPSESTFRRVLISIDHKQFELCFTIWAQRFRKVIKGDILCFDGKTARGSRTTEERGFHFLNVWSYENGIVLGQNTVDKKTNEITAIPEILDMLFLEDCTVTLDAMGCQKEIAEKITKKNGDYLICLKGNQEGLHRDVKKDLESLLDSGNWSKNESYYESKLEIDHGRIEHRRCLAKTVDTEVKDYDGAHLWAGLKTVAIIESTRIEKVSGKKSTERRCFITSLKCDAKKILETSRAHWSVENSLHWVLDVSCREDNSKIYTKNGPKIMSALRKMGVNFVKADKETKRSFRKRQRKASLSLDYLEKILVLGFS
jgi:predicted transposase YbfD/YdcC